MTTCLQAASNVIALMSKRIGRWRGEADKYAGPEKTVQGDWLRAGDFHDVQGSPSAPPINRTNTRLQPTSVRAQNPDRFVQFATASPLARGVHTRIYSRPW